MATIPFYRGQLLLWPGPAWRANALPVRPVNYAAALKPRAGRERRHQLTRLERAVLAAVRFAAWVHAKANVRVLILRWRLSNALFAAGTGLATAGVELRRWRVGLWMVKLCVPVFWLAVRLEPRESGRVMPQVLGTPSTSARQHCGENRHGMAQTYNPRGSNVQSARLKAGVNWDAKEGNHGI